MTAIDTLREGISNSLAVFGANAVAQVVHSADVGLGAERLVLIRAAHSKNNEVGPKLSFSNFVRRFGAKNHKSAMVKLTTKSTRIELSFAANTGMKCDSTPIVEKFVSGADGDLVR